MRKNKLIVLGILLSMIFLTPLNLVLENNLRNLDNEEINALESEDDNLNLSDVAGSDLYAEKINAFIAGNKSIIKQSLFTNDTNILSQFDSNDPAFYKCNLIISASNGINSGGCMRRPIRESSKRSFSNRCIFSVASVIRAISECMRGWSPAAVSSFNKPKNPRMVIRGLLRSCETV